MPSPRTSSTLPALFEHEQPAVGGKLHCGRADQPCNHRGFDETGWQCRQGQTILHRLELGAKGCTGDPPAAAGSRQPIDCQRTLP